MGDFTESQDRQGGQADRWRQVVCRTRSWESTIVVWYTARQRQNDYFTTLYGGGNHWPVYFDAAAAADRMIDLWPKIARCATDRQMVCTWEQYTVAATNISRDVLYRLACCVHPILMHAIVTERIWLTGWARSMTSWMDCHGCTRLYRKKWI